MRRGITLPELISVITILGVVAAIMLPPLGRALDRFAVRHAADRIALVHETGRQLAIARGRSVRFSLDTAAAVATLEVQRSRTVWDTAISRPLGRATVATGQPTIVFGPAGLALGLSNSSIVISRGAFAETLTVSRTGRLKRPLVVP